MDEFLYPSWRDSNAENTNDGVIITSELDNEFNIKKDDSYQILNISQSSNCKYVPLHTEDSLSSFPDRFEQMNTGFNEKCQSSSDFKYLPFSQTVSETNSAYNIELNTLSEETNYSYNAHELYYYQIDDSNDICLSDELKPSHTSHTAFNDPDDDQTCQSHTISKNLDFTNKQTEETNCTFNDDDQTLQSYTISKDLDFPKKQTRNPEKQLTRKRHSNALEWKAEKAKQANLSGNTGESKTGSLISKRSMGFGCSNCRYLCNQKIKVDQRVTIFKEFWNLADHNRQWDYIARCMETKYIESSSKRSISNSYFLCVSSNLIKVCQTMFLHTLGISKESISTIVKKKISTEGFIQCDQRGKHKNRPKRITSPVRQSVKKHIGSFPVKDSHYCRKETKKTYLEGNLSLQTMYNKYVDSMKEDGITDIASEHLYRNIFNHEYNIEFHKPKKDLCDQCTAFEQMSEAEKVLLAANQDKHLFNKTRARELMAGDKEDAANNSEICAVCFDVEQTLTTPRLDVSMSYYKRKLNIYNFTIYNLATHEGFCYVWNETLGGKGANEIASCLWDFIHKKASSGTKEFRFFSDNCGAQNRNKMLYSMYIRVAHALKVKITHRYLEKGHTYNEGDSMHATIENSCKNINVFSQSEWCEIMKKAKKKEPFYSVNEISQSQILDFRPLANDQNWKAVKISCLREIEVLPNNANVFIKYEYNDISLPILIPTKKCRNKNYPLLQLYVKKIELDKEKKKDLEFMCSKGVIPNIYYDFYKSLTQ